MNLEASVAIAGVAGVAAVAPASIAFPPLAPAPTMPVATAIASLQAGWPASQQAMPASFGALVTQGLGQVNQQLLASQTDLQQLAVGSVENLHQIMIGLEESRLSFQLLMQVRNRVLEAYQDVMKMPL